MAQQKRIRPRLSLTLDPEVYRRLQEVQVSLPGSSLSGLVSEVLDVGLPVLEGLVETLREAKGDAESIDEDRAREALARWAGAQLLEFAGGASAASAVRQVERIGGKEK